MQYIFTSKIVMDKSDQNIVQLYANNEMIEDYLSKIKVV